jgi:hypothetical protein
MNDNFGLTNLIRRHGSCKVKMKMKMKQPTLKIWLPKTQGVIVKIGEMVKLDRIAKKGRNTEIGMGKI